MVSITGTLIWYYYICKREVWFLAHDIEADQNNDFIEIGRSISENSYQREKKEIRIDNIVIDLISKGDEKLVVAEVKKTSKFIKSAEMQLIFYLWQLKQKGIENLVGELRVPMERKKFTIKLTQDKEKELLQVCDEIKNIMSMENPPPLQKNIYCKKCAYYEFCWV